MRLPMLGIALLLLIALVNASVSVSVQVKLGSHKSHHPHLIQQSEEKASLDSFFDPTSPPIVISASDRGKALSILSSPNDPYGELHYLTFGPLSGSILFTKYRRSIKILQPNQYSHLNINTSPGDIVFANFLSEGQFWIAHYSANTVSRVIDQAALFRLSFPRVGHTQYRFLFTKPIRLYKQYPTQSDPKVPLLSDIILSNEALSVLNLSTGKELEGYSPLTSGIRQRYALVFRVMNSADRLHEYETEPVIEQKELLLSAEAKNAIFIKALSLSNANYNLPRPYNTFLNSCISTFFAEVIDVALAQFHKTFYDKIRAKITGIAHLNPAQSGTYLKLRGIKWKALPNMDWSGLQYNGPKESTVPIKHDEIAEFENNIIREVKESTHARTRN